jgi:thioredoxin 2
MPELRAHEPRTGRVTGDAPQRRFDVQAIPTMLLLRDGQIAARQAGAVPLAALRAWVDGSLAGH